MWLQQEKHLRPHHIWKKIHVNNNNVCNGNVFIALRFLSSQPVRPPLWSITHVVINSVVINSGFLKCSQQHQTLLNVIEYHKAHACSAQSNKRYLKLKYADKDMKGWIKSYLKADRLHSNLKEHYDFQIM